jgi:hypothetical protein
MKQLGVMGMRAQQIRCAPSPHPNSGLPEFGTLSGPKSDISDFGGGESWGEGVTALSRQPSVLA